MNKESIAEGLTHASDTRVIEVGRGILSRSGEILSRSLAQIDRPVLIVADERTWAAAGRAVAASIEQAGLPQAEALIFPGTPTLYAAYEHAEEVRERLRATSALGIAVGSGTLNDLVKLASGELGQPYAVVGTAASMDGYSGFGAPMSQGGVKITMPCPAPAVVIFDLDVAAAAPKVMTASGYGDLAAKLPAGADWILSDAIGLDPINPLAWNLVQGGVCEALSRPEALASAEPDAYEGLVKGLLLSGLAMQVYQGTRPASGAEHYFSHLWELDHVGADLEPPLSHGFKVAIGTLAMTAFYERFLQRDFGSIDVQAAVDAWPTWDELETDIRSKLAGPLAEKGVRETREKYVDAAGLRVRVQTLVDAWPALRPRLETQLVPAATLQRSLAAAGTPTHPEQIGLTLTDLRDTFPRAMYYRSRYTVLDVSREIGWFEELVDEVFAPGGLWT